MKNNNRYRAGMPTEHLIEIIKEFNSENGRWPSNGDWGPQAGYGLPTRRSIERSHGGLVNIRTILGLTPDERKGEIRKKVALKALEREGQYNVSVYKKLKEFFPPEHIHVESQIYDRGRNRTDFKIYVGGDVYLIDVFFANDAHSWRGCVRHKVKKYQNEGNGLDGNLKGIYLVSMNPKLSKEEEHSAKVMYFPDVKIDVFGYSKLLEICDRIKTK